MENRRTLEGEIANSFANEFTGDLLREVGYYYKYVPVGDDGFDVAAGYTDPITGLDIIVDLEDASEKQAMNLHWLLSVEAGIRYRFVKEWANPDAQPWTKTDNNGKTNKA